MVSNAEETTGKFKDTTPFASSDDGYRYVLVLNIEPCNKVRNAFVLEGSCFLIPGL